MPSLRGAARKRQSTTRRDAAFVTRRLSGMAAAPGNTVHILRRLSTLFIPPGAFIFWELKRTDDSSSTVDVAEVEKCGEE